MANIFDRDYSQASLSPQQRIEDISRKSRVPVNVLLGATELAGARDDDEKFRVAQAVAAEFGPRIQAGEDIKALIREAAGGDEPAKAFIARSRQIADELYPEQTAKARATRAEAQKGGMGAALGIGVDALQQGYGSAVEGAGKAMGLPGVEAYGADVAARNRAQIEEAAPGLTGLDEVDGIGSALKFAGETMAQQVPQLGVSIGAGIAGAKGGAVLGGAVGGPAGAAIGSVVGGIGAGIAANLPFFYGQNRERQKDAIDQGIITEMDEGAAALTAIPQAALDTIADRLMIGAIAGPLAKTGGGILTRGVRGAAEGIISEVPTEIGQSILERAQAGLPLDSEDAIREYRDVGIAAGLIGGTVGGAAGAIGGKAEPVGPIAEQGEQEDPAADQVLPPMLALPAPNRGGTIFGEGAPGVDPTVREREPWMPRSGDVAPVAQPAQIRPQTPPGGPLRAALQSAAPLAPIEQNAIAGEGQAPAMEQPMGAAAGSSLPAEQPAPMGDPLAGPVPQRTMRGASEMAPAPLFADMPPKSPIVINVPGLAPIKATFLGSTPLGVQIVDQDGEVSEITREEIEGGAVQIAPASPALGGQTAASSPAAQVPGPAQMPLEEAQRRLVQVEDLARARGWSRDLLEMRDSLRQIVGQQALGDQQALAEKSKLPVDAPAQPPQGLGQLGAGESDQPVIPQEVQDGQRLDQAPFLPADAPDAIAGTERAAPVRGIEQGASAGNPALVAPRRDNPEERSAGADAPSAVDDAVAPGEPASALIGADPDPEAESEARAKAFQSAQQAAQHARENRVVSKTLPGRQAKGAPLAEIEVGPHPQGGFMLRHALNTQARGHSINFEGQYGTPEAAEQAARAFITDRARRILSERVDLTNEQEQADAKKVLKWLGDAPADQNPIKTSAAPTPVIEEIRSKAAILRGVPQDAPPAVSGVTLKWDDKEGGFIFSRKHVEAVKAAAIPAQAAGMTDDAAKKSEDVMKSLVAATVKKPIPTKPDAKTQDFNDYIAAVLQTREWAITSPRGKDADRYEAHLSRSRFREIEARYESERGSAQPVTDAGAQIEAAAAETAVDPTPAQAEAENYRTGKADWNGLKLSIENAKGSTRRKVTPDGKTAWEVTMPAHYGRILRTEGADGDHVDFYMGDKPESEWAYVVDQVDAKSGAFDEHKLMLGFGSRAEAEATYDAAFSDGKGPQRRAAVTEMAVQQAKDWLANGDTKKPVADLAGLKAKAEAQRNADDARETAKVAKKAEEDRKAQEDLRASVGRIEDLKGGTARAVVEWGDGDRFMDAGGYTGHGKFVLRKGVFADFDALAQGKNPTLTGEGPEAGVKRLEATASKSKSEIEWRFVRNVSGKPHSVAGRVATPSLDGKRGSRWVEIDRRVHNFVQRNGLKLTAGDDPGIMAIRRADGELVGFTASIRPYMNSKGADLDAMDAIAHPATEASAIEPPNADSTLPVAGPLPDNSQPEATARSAGPAKPSRIEDFGEKIGGARKDVWSGFKEKMAEAEGLDVSAEPLSKSWPEPDYEKLIAAGIDPWTVAFLRSARDHIPRKPVKSWKLKDWAAAVKQLRSFGNQLMSGDIDKETLVERLKDHTRLNNDITGRIALYEAVGHAKSLKDLKFGQNSYSMLNGERFSPNKSFWEVTKEQASSVFSTMPKTVVRAETKADAIAKFKEVYGALDESGAPKGNKGKGTKFLIYSKRNEQGTKYRIGVKIGSSYIDLRTGIADVKEARRIIAEESDQLQAQLDRMRDIPKERRDENAPRIGVDHRNGADVTPEMFTDAFAFKGVEFGNWVEAGRRQEDLNNAFDALMDLASILDLPSKAMSLNGTLGLAFGARGSGGKNPAAAHFEPGKVVINLTKRQGRGSLAHEWFHALDNYFARRRAEMRGTYITDNNAPGSSPLNAGVRPEMIDAFSAVKRAILSTDLRKRSENLDKLRSDPYWGTGIEMHARAFESYVIAKLQDQNSSNDYLANVVNGTAWAMAAEMSGLGDSYPYLKPNEVEVVRPEFDRLFQAIETRETDRGVEMYSAFSDQEMASVPVEKMRALSDAVRREVESVGLASKVTPRVVRGLLGASGVPVQGRYRAGEIDVNAAAADPVGVARHEIIHALRDPQLWDNTHGLFTPDEWKALVRAARADKALMQRVERAYKDRPATVQTEEAVAEMYREWAGARDAKGPLSRIFAKVRALFRAMASALRGEGFTDAALVMDRIASGQIGGRGPDGPGRGRGNAPSSEMRSAAGRRPVGFDDVIIGGELGSITSHPDYAAAKAGDVVAAVRLARDMVTDDLVKRVRSAIGNGRAVIVPVISEEASGRNKIPLAAAEVLAHRIGTAATATIGQRNAPRRTSLSGLDRIFASPEFSGEVIAGQDYLLLDDTLTQGGTFAALASHIEANGGKVVGAVALTGKQYSAKVKPSPKTLSALREQHGDLEQDFIAATGYGFDSLTESEARYLANFKPADAIRVRVLDEGRRRSAGENQGNASTVIRNRLSADDDGAMEMRDALMQTSAKAKGMIGRDQWRTPSDWLTDAMAGFGSGDYSLLALVPGRALFSELGKKLVSAKAYLRLKEEMDAMRNGWHQTADDVAQQWLTLRRKDAKANDEMMDLMHRATLAGIDPSKPDPFDEGALKAARDEVSRRGDRAGQWARDQIAFAERRAESRARLKDRFDALPQDFQAMYRKVLKTYSAIADDFDKAVLENIQNATRIGIKRAEREYEKALRRISDDGLKGTERAEAMQLAKAKLDAVKKRGGFAAKARISALRKQFESNRLKGPYFPLARFGEYFVTVRGDDGKVISFARFEGVKQQMTHVREMEEIHPGRVQHGVMSDAASLKSQVDPTFVADVERILAESGADFAVMDAVWQRWLETLPDQSIRTAKIHRKGREGWNQDAFRAFGKHMFHGSHQLARLKYGLQMSDLMEEAELEARRSDDPNRLGLITKEMQKRHKFTMEPKGSSAIAGLSSLAFVWYLGATPAAALANISQTTVVGIPVLSARFKKSGVAGVMKELGRASADFGRGKGQKLTDPWSAANSEALSADERAAMAEAYRRGTVDRTQAHDLASVAETGIEYNATRERVMKAIGWFFHHAERFNREVTFLAGYRLARAEGLTHDSAVDAAADVTWKTHYDYQNTARPRFMQGDIGKVLTQFRQFTVNTLWRLFRDAHQTFKGETPEARAEAKTQLIGITLSMMAHAGIKGTWGYGMAMLLLGLLTPGAEDDDIEAWLQDALLMEGDTPGVAAWNFAMGAALNGAPGQILGVDLKERIGMPNLWFRGPSRDLEGEDLYVHYVGELLGPTFGIGAGLFRGLDYAADGEVYRGIETAVPKVIRDGMKAGRYAAEGVVTQNGDDILPDVNPWQMLMQASGFTPAQIAERYDINSRLKNQEARIMDERSAIHKRASEAMRGGEGLPPAVIEAVRDFNKRFPEYPITADTIRQSLQGRIRASQRNEFGVSLNPKLNDRLRGSQPPSIYN